VTSRHRSSTVIVAFALVLLAGVFFARRMAKMPAQVETSIAQTEAALDATLAATPSPNANAEPSPAASPTPSTALGASAADTESLAADRSAQAEFERLSETALAAIPTRADLQKLDPESVHFTPQAVIAASLEIGKVAELLSVHPELSAKGLSFYKECAEQESAAESVRASCLAEFVRLSKKSTNDPEAEKIEAPRVPKRIAALAKKILS
jgi:hypothetical protein